MLLEKTSIVFAQFSIVFTKNCFFQWKITPINLDLSLVFGYKKYVTVLIKRGKKTVAKVVILGAGLTGLSTAYHLEKNNFFDFKIFEKETTHGGLARSVKHDGFTFDFTGHFLHCNDNYFATILNDLLPENTCNTIARNSFIYLHNTFVPYPIQMNLAGLPANVIAECLCGFAKRKHYIKNPKTFRSWVFKYFGTGLAKHFFFPYNEKLLCSKAEKIHPSWTGRFVPKTTIQNLIESLTRNSTNKHVGYNHHFYYPKHGGIQFFTDNLRGKIKSPIHTLHKAITIDVIRKKIIFANGSTEKYETLITTIPLNSLLKIIHEPSSINISNSYKKLLCNSVVNFNLGFTPHNFTQKHWIYFPEKKYTFYRVGFWSNFSEHMCPKSCSSLYGELAYLPEKKNEKEVALLTRKCIQKTCDTLGITQSQIVTQKTLYLPHAYVIHDSWRAKNISKIHETLNNYSIHSIGRYGEWKYASMEEAILDGKEMATKVTEKHDIKVKIMQREEIYEKTKQL